VSLKSVLDVGCGRGTWLGVWREFGIDDVVGIDGAYVNRARLAIPPDRFIATDITQHWDLGRRFDLVQSMEVAEHILPDCSEAFIARLCASGDVVLFSAAQPGQGGEMHINEQTPEFWARLFEKHGYARFDCLRAHVAKDRSIEPWYRFNAFLFANGHGQERLSDAARATLLPAAIKAKEYGGLAWRARKLLLRGLSVETVTKLSRINYRVMTTFRAIQNAG
jgi:SAM-dependent methyltransferase